jgi:hypothetical protein
MHLELSDDEVVALIRELADIVENDRYPLSPRIRTLRAILAKLRPEPAREPLPPPKVYEPPRTTATRSADRRIFNIGRQPISNSRREDWGNQHA